MKTKKINKNLGLGKSTIANLNAAILKDVKGGKKAEYTDHDECYTNVSYCAWCVTEEYTCHP